MIASSEDSNVRAYEIEALRSIAKRVPNIDSAIAEIARFSAELTLPKGTIHVISDIHGEDKKLRHVINNASGTLRPLVEKLLKEKLPAKEFEDFLTLIFYPAEVVGELEKTLREREDQETYAFRTLHSLFEVVRVLAARHSLKHAVRLFPAEYSELFTEILHEPSTERESAYVGAIVKALVNRGRVLHFIHLTCRLIRNLAIDELIIAGDCWDRGPRGDKVVDYLMQQPNVSFVWGNHDVLWLGACLGSETLICTVLRISLRYRRFFQLEEGYGIPLSPLEYLAREVYGDDPAECFMPKGDGTRETIAVARMQKAVAVMQFKLEGQLIARHPEWGIPDRMLMHRMDLKAGTITIEGVTYDLKDKSFPTVDPADPYELSAEERTCLSRLKASFHASQKLWDHMKWMVKYGSMVISREEQLIFHACVPVDSKGELLPMVIEGRALAGRPLFEAIDRAVFRMVDEKPTRNDLDMLWYLWSGPQSPLFGKDKMATLERALIADKTPHDEPKNPYFDLLHEDWFCRKLLEEFGSNPDDGIIVNGHVPVKVEKGESPIKRSGKAITIDGAFSEAYGDHGYTLVMEPHRTFIARHHHFESVEAAVLKGADIIPTITVVRDWDVPKQVVDSRRGRDLGFAISHLEQLIEAYRNHEIPQRASI
ncbi:MAG: fructose-1,6-bisphosphatase [Akkermansiaceae bacterium]|nr:fructose-1,6-bisphosphatase [Akkermansiaceae bacterium]MDP4646365.1 fructose-1,6-bisphosphatase [Akkermansiaceae bacterium]MDP4721944.1 fructose-1,6-bisphosphatase [Akkermansiaceae bacterium]MDP4779968.1 fructose-1,6-bisphosphatase [Akkermansiaceae bacterium]MDP4897189.1 fructose-1,6-bisphosphatase [Akkermansiaceae bacterium]